ncbi:MAG: hypothetical protein J6Y20_01080 [Lachnospiraceae bacterium]|nr:hypothetical protein [Lachnospiraceae bacterium]
MIPTFEVWTVVEIQGNELDPSSSISTCYRDESTALAGYFQSCAAAAQSSLAYHAVVLIPPSKPFDGRIQYWQIFDRRGD